ncbi:hypothetical protein A176_005140 [Myxococcus hansupus]|uniref:Uncharacterized protein n=1 Tax=Pseudomyxococcus hansupus TaxID=1297742 RepID=A0A0H4X2W1_9BACT|nr:hypothetical protein A176_005140 [Myxococcus hansupus]
MKVPVLLHGAPAFTLAVTSARSKLEARARRYTQSRESLVEYSLTQFFKEAERYRP